jgi:hypothetical protein
MSTGNKNILNIPSPQLMKELIGKVQRGDSKLCNQFIRFRCKDVKVTFSSPLDNDLYLIVYSVKDSPYFYIENLIKGSIIASDFIFTAAKIYETIRDSPRPKSHKYVIDELTSANSKPVFNNNELKQLSENLNGEKLNDSAFIHIQFLLQHLKENSNGTLNLGVLHITI